MQALALLGFLPFLSLLAIPLFIAHVLIFTFIASLLGQTRGRPMDIGKAVYCYLSQAFGAVLMTFGSLPALHSVLARSPLSTQEYIGLLIMFATGGLIFLLHESMACDLHEDASAVPYALFFFTCKMIGLLCIVLGAITLLLMMLFNVASTPDWWVMPTVVLVYGLIVSWCTRLEDAMKPMSEPSLPPIGKPAVRMAPPPQRPVTRVAITSSGSSLPAVTKTSALDEAALPPPPKAKKKGK